MPVRTLFSLSLLAGLLAAAAPALADDKYQFMKATESRVWRLNTDTGEITVCSLAGENLVCTTSAKAATPDAKTYAEMQKEKAEAERQLVAERKKREDTEMKIIERFLAFFRELLTLSREQEGSGS
jgi:hypothetical protein